MNIRILKKFRKNYLYKFSDGKLKVIKIDDPYKTHEVYWNEIKLLIYRLGFITSNDYFNNTTKIIKRRKLTLWKKGII